ncbi:IclR family transcriptional regulator [Haladaptatus caseinilyticus]|uniref:IclR family transcriptional regulator n=1 Tax=Haladaptatus caseinilyticus TaxID=2993314 RepID=UPI00224A6A8C|nr:IclR family transcriptional regulator [Haladaptatus caseinilyticus]
MNDEEETPGQRLKSVDQAFQIIEYLRENGPVTLSEITDDLELPMSTAHVHLSTLVANEYVIKSEREYRCSLRFLRVGGEMRDKLSLFQTAKDEVDDLSDTLGEYANVGTIENGYMVQLYKSRNSSSIDDNAPLGSHLYLHSTGLGKAMLSRLSQERLDMILDLRGLPKLTPTTITDRQALEKELAEIRDRGYAVNRSEHFTGVCAVAVPILSERNEVIGAISASGPISRMGDTRIEEEIAPALFDKQNFIELKIKQ